MKQQYKEIIGAIASHYWGPVNHALSTPGKELRFGTHGSKSVDLIKGTWFDHEQAIGGGAADLVKVMEPGASIVEKLEQFGLPREPLNERRETVFDYTDADGEIRYQVVRIDHNGQKTYRQRHIDVDGKPVWGMTGVTALPYRLHEIAASTAAIFICEGEKAADAVAGLGLLATTNHGGAGKFWPSIVEHFRGRDVVILPDQDAPGERHARQVADALTGTAKSIRILRLPGLPPKGDAVDWIARGGSKQELVALAKAQRLYDPLTAGEMPPEPIEPAKKPRVELVHFDDVADIPIQWLVQDLVPAGGFCALYGKPGSYKSFVALYIATMIGQGREAFGKATEQGDVVYLMGEGGSGLKARRDALVRHYEIPPGTRVHFIRAQLNLRSTDEDATALIQCVQDKGLKPKLLVIDTLARAFGAGNENASEDMGAFILQCGRIQHELSTAVMVVHHSGKDEARGLRGHSSLLGAADCELEVVKLSAEDNPDRIGQMTVTKQKDGEDGIAIGYRMATVQLSAIDPDKTSLAVVPVDKDELEGLRAPKKRPLSAQQKLVLEALERAVEEHGEAPRTHHIPASAKVVRVSLWRSTFYTMSPNEADAKQKAFKRASEALVASRTCQVWGDYAWISEGYRENGHAGH